METTNKRLNICNVCGANLEPKDGHWHCPACGYYKTEETISELDTLLYGAEQELRKANFDTAEEDYSDIVEKFPNISAGYWGRMKARYGIKYEKDEQDKYLPTCFAEVESVLNDRDYLVALRYADVRNAAVYKKEAQKIETIRKIWMEKAATERPYDIFICFKDTEEDGKHTVDSRKVRDLYGYLTEQGYRVFFSPVSLMGKAGEEYEPYIYNALNTSAVMIVYGSKPEYFESVWMKNEWSRFLKRIREKKKSEGSLLVVCDSMNPVELPIALRKIQALDAQALSFISTLSSRVKAIVEKTRKPTNVLERVQLTREIGKKAQSIGNHISTIAIPAASNASIKKATGEVETYAVAAREIGQYSLPSLSLDESRKIKIVKNYLSEKMYDDALKFADNILSEHEASGEAALLKFLILAKVESLATLKETTEELNDFALLHKVIECNEKNIAEKFLFSVGEYITRRLSDIQDLRRFEKMYPLTKEIAAYDSDAAYTLLKNIDYTSALKLDFRIGEEYYRLFLSRQKRNDVDLFISLHNTFITQCINAGAIEMAKKYNDEVLSWDESNYRTNIVDFVLKKNNIKIVINTPITDDDAGADTLFLTTVLPESTKFSALREIIEKLSQSDAEKIFALFSKFLLNKTPDGMPSALTEWYKFVLQYAFSGREETIEGLFTEVSRRHDPERAGLFDTLEGFLPPGKIEEHILCRREFAKLAQKNGEFALAKKYYNKVIEIDEGNVAVRWCLLCCDAHAKDNKSLGQSIGMLTNFSCIPNLLKYCDEKARAYYLNCLMEAVFTRSETALSKEIAKKCSAVFDELMKYFPENPAEDIEKIMHIADICKRSGAFESGHKYYGMALSIDNKISAAYWGGLQCKLNCLVDSELVTQKTALADCEEFNSALGAATTQEESLYYIQIQKKQMEWCEAERKRIAEEKRRKMEQKAQAKRERKEREEKARAERVKEIREQEIKNTIFKMKVYYALAVIFWIMPILLFVVAFDVLSYFPHYRYYRDGYVFFHPRLRAFHALWFWILGAFFTYKYKAYKAKTVCEEAVHKKSRGEMDLLKGKLYHTLLVISWITAILCSIELVRVGIYLESGLFIFSIFVVNFATWLIYKSWGLKDDGGSKAITGLVCSVIFWAFGLFLAIQGDPTNGLVHYFPLFMPLVIVCIFSYANQKYKK